jgi:hypothetical protein
MDITSKPNLKPFRSWDESEIINGLFAATTAVLNKGTFVTITQASGNTNVMQTGTLAPAAPHLGVASNFGGAPSYAISKRWALNWRVRAANPGEVVLGVIVKDVAEVNKFGESYVYRPRYEKNEQQVVNSGESVPILTRGLISTNNFSGVPVPGSGATVSGGMLMVSAYSATSVGKFLTTVDADGYALFKVEC